MQDSPILLEPAVCNYISQEPRPSRIQLGFQISLSCTEKNHSLSPQGKAFPNHLEKPWYYMNFNLKVIYMP